jgi:hypothetical protein
MIFINYLGQLAQLGDINAQSGGAVNAKALHAR